MTGRTIVVLALLAYGLAASIASMLLLSRARQLDARDVLDLGQFVQLDAPSPSTSRGHAITAPRLFQERS